MININLSIALSQDHDISETFDIIATAENKEYDILFVTDEGLSRSPFAILAMGALITKRINLGTGVTSPYTRNPGFIASAIATIDEISRGRALLGIGVGSSSYLKELGINARDVISTLKRAVTVIRKLLRGENVTDKVGEFELFNAKLNFSPNRDIPIYIAGRGPNILRLAGEVADGAILGAGLVSQKGVNYAFDNLKRGATKVKKQLEDLDAILWAFCSIANESDLAKDPIRPIIARIVSDVPATTLIKIGIPYEKIKKIKLQTHRIQKMDKQKLRCLVTDDLVDQFSIAGTPEECFEKIKELADAGIKHIAVLPIENPENDVKKTTEQLPKIATGL